MTIHHLRYLLSAIAIIAGIILIMYGMDFYRALYLIIFGVLLIPAGMTGLHSKETPKGVKFWARKVLANTLDLMTATSLASFLIPNSTYEFKGIITWLCAGVICGILFGTFDYSAHNTGDDEAEFEAKKKPLQETGELYNKIVEEMHSDR